MGHQVNILHKVCMGGCATGDSALTGKAIHESWGSPTLREIYSENFLTVGISAFCGVLERSRFLELGRENFRKRTLGKHAKIALKVER